MKIYKLHNEVMVSAEDISAYFNIKYSELCEVVESKLENSIDNTEYCYIDDIMFLSYAGCHLVFRNSNVSKEKYDVLMNSFRECGK